MLRECLDVFQHQLNEKSEKLILDSYIPADGTYLIVDKDGNIKTAIEIKMDKKTRKVERSSTYFPQICYYDYHSQLVSMNKPISNKIVHSNNYLSFFVKKDSVVSGKLTEDIIDDYYEMLKNPVEQKYKKSKEASKIYELFEKTDGKVNQNALERNRQWIKKHIWNLENVDMDRKDYLKIFFEAEDKEFLREDKRYLLPNIYNSNDYNLEIENKVYGLPDNNLGMNAKKPFLSVKSRKYPASYLLDGDSVMLQKQFFDYLLNFASAGKFNIYVDTKTKQIKAYSNSEVPEKIEAGYYLRIKKGTELEIQNQDNLPGYEQELKEKLDFQNILGVKHEKHPEYDTKYHRYYKRLEVGELINEVYFLKLLSGNYFTESGDIGITDEVLKRSILESREQIFNWVYKGIDYGFPKTLDRVSLELIKGSILNGYRERALWQFNLRWSFEMYFSERGGNNMAEIISDLRQKIESKVLADITNPIENDEEYFYAVGQLAAYLISLSKAKDKNHSLLNPLMNAKTDEVIKKRILQMYKKYNYNISIGNKRVNNLLAMVEGYSPDGKINQEKIMLGYVCNNVIYMKEDK